MNKGILTGSSSYLIGGIERAKDCFSWRNEVTKRLNLYGINVFDPNKDHFINLPTESEGDRELLKIERDRGNYDFVHKYLAKVIQRDLRMVDLSTFVIAHIDPDIPTWGSTHEIVLAVQQRKPVLIHTQDKKKFPLWLFGLLKHELIFENWGDLMEYVRKIHFEEIEVNSKYWKILSHE